MVNKFVLMIILALVVNGCWDLREIEDRGYILGVGLDSYNQLKGEMKPEEFLPNKRVKPKFVFTAQIPIWKKGQMATGGGGAGGSQGQKGATWNISVVGSSLMEMNRELATRVSYPPFYEDLEVLVLSREVAREGMYSWMDWFIRDNEIRRTVRVFVTPGHARKVLETSPEIESYSSPYLKELSGNIHRTGHIMSAVPIGDISTYRYSGLDFLLPEVKKIGRELKDAGSIIMKDGHMVGALGEQETQAANMILNKYQGGVNSFYCRKHPQCVVSIEVTKVMTKITPRIEGNRVTFDVKVKATGTISEVDCFNFHDEGSLSFIKRAEQEANKRIQEDVVSTLNKLQDKRADAVHLISSLKTNNYRDWKRLKKDWGDQGFQQARFKVSVTSEIKTVGMLR